MDDKPLPQPIDERNRILFEWNDTHSDYQPILIQESFEKHAKAFPQQIAIHFEGETITYGELNEKANRLAHLLKEKKVTNDTLVAICIEPSFDLFIGILAILKAGGAYVPLDKNYPTERLHYMLENTNSPILLTQSHLTSHFDHINAEIICYDLLDGILPSKPNSNPDPINQINDLVYIIYTSGSTGKPKGVMITHGNLNTFLHWFSKALNIYPTDIFDFSSSISFDFSVATTLFPLSMGAQIAICPESYKKDPYQHIKFILENKISFIKITPSHFRQFKEFVNDEHLFSDLRYIVFGGELLYTKDISDWILKFPHHIIINEYGPTEATVATSWMKVDKNNINDFQKGIPIGKPALNTQLYILDEDLNPVSVQEEGELYIGGEGIARGYFNNSEITQLKFIRNPFSSEPHARLYKTGDLCRYLPNGLIEFIERVDHQVKIRGFRIELDEIENCLRSHPSIKDAIVLPQEDHIDQTGEKRLAAYYITKESTSKITSNELLEFTQHHLPDYMVPSFFISMSVFPLTQNKKIDRKAFPKPTIQHQADYLPPRTEIEEQVKKIWEEVLNIDHISVNDNFFELGGHSLAAARIISKIVKQFHKEIKMENFIEGPTIGELASIISHAQTIEQHKLHDANHSYLLNETMHLSDIQMLFWLAQKSYSKSKGLNIVARKRLTGDLNLALLEQAFKNVLLKHEVLSYYISPYIPLQKKQKNIKPKLTHIDIQYLNSLQKDNELHTSLDNFKHYNIWKKGEPLVAMRVFHLGNHTYEMQLCMSHLISDEISPELFFQDLSHFYLANENKKSSKKIEQKTFKDYLHHETNQFKLNLKRDTEFWKKYLEDCTLLSFPNQHVLQEKEVASVLGSTYLEIPEFNLEKLRSICAEHRVSLTDGLLAIVGKAINKYLACHPSNDSRNIAINLIKSTRDNEHYDPAIGFFVRTDLIKLNLSNQPNLVELSKRIQRASAETAPYQYCPAIIKLASLFQTRWKNKPLRNAIANAISKFLSPFLKKFNLSEQVTLMYARMFLSETHKNFLVEINFLNNFFVKYKPHHKLFGYELLPLSSYKDDKMVAKNVLDICFIRDDYHKPFLILSGNLNPNFRQEIGNEVINLLLSHTNNNLKFDD